MPRCPSSPAAGFSLIEMAIGLALLSLLAGGLLFTLQSQQQALAYREAQQQLEMATEALLGYAISHGRLPCPAAPASNAGSEDRPDAESPCAREHGTLPWSTLALPETDPWGRRLSYYAHGQFTGPVAAGALASFTLDSAGNANIKDAAAAGYDIASALPAVIVSHGPNGTGAYRSDGNRLPGATSDEAENADADTTFVSRPPDGQFDDLVAWTGSAILIARLVAAGRLP